MKLSPNQLALVCAATLADATKYYAALNEATLGAGIVTLERAAMFFGQVAHESGRLSRVEENLSYSAKRMTVVWPKRFPTVASAQPYAMNPRALANKVYGGRMGNMNPDDGWRYRGRGLKQLTGHDNYKMMTNELGFNYLDFPELVATPVHAVATAVRFWSRAGGNTYADKGDYKGLTRAINGGLIGYEDGNDEGLDDRVELYEYARAKLAALGLSVF